MLAHNYKIGEVCEILASVCLYAQGYWKSCSANEFSWNCGSGRPWTKNNLLDFGTDSEPESIFPLFNIAKYGIYDIFVNFSKAVV